MAYIGAGITRFNTADELTVTGTSEFGGNVSFGDNNITNVGSLQIDSIAGDADTNTNITFAGSDVITMTTAGSERLRITSAGSVGIGTSSPATTLEVNTTLPVIRSTHSTSGDYLQLFHNGSGAYIDFSADPLIIRGASNAERMRIDTSGNVAIGGADTAYGKFSVRGGFVYINEDNANTNQIYIRSDLGGDPAIQVATSHALKLFTSNQERLRIDSSGNLLVGRTDTSSTTAGTVIYGGSTKGAITQTFAGRPLYINRLTTDGDIIEFAKDGTTVGNIGVNTDRLFIGDSSFGGIAFPSGGSGVLPAGGSGALNDNTHDLGNSSTRFKDLYLSSSAKITNSSGNASVELTSSTSGTSFINMGDTGDADIGQISYVNNGNSMRFTTNASERLRIDSSGNVGIGVTTATELNEAGFRELVIGGATEGAGITIKDADANVKMGMFTSDASNSGVLRTITNHPLTFRTNNTERMRVDSSGNLQLGKTASGIGTNGITLFGDGAIGAADFTRDGGRTLALNRKTSDGDIVEFRKDGTTVGSIGTNGDRPFFKNSTYGGLKVGTGYSVDPANNSTGAGWDNALDLGAGGTRWKDLYLSGGAYIGGTGSANKLDDYEIGNWTPSFENTIHPNPTVTYTYQIGRYTKVGNRVHWTARIGWSAFSVNGSGYALLVGFPFTADSTTAFSQGANLFGYASGIGGSYGLSGLYIDPGTNKFYMTTGANPTAELTGSNISSSGAFYCGGSVQVS